MQREIKELDVVSAVLPGSKPEMVVMGTVVHDYEDGENFEVEFFSGVFTMKKDELTLKWPSS